MATAQREATLRSLTVSQLLAVFNSEQAGAANRAEVQYLRDGWGSAATNPDGTLNFVRALRCVREKWERKRSEAPVDWDIVRQQIRAKARAAAREIGEIPAVKDPELRAACDASLKTFLQTVFSDIFYLPFSPAHDELIGHVERCVKQGGHQAFACERGFGKTQISIGACLWGSLTGRVRYSMIIGANSEKATAQRDGIKRRLETNQRLYDLYPEICFPMRVTAASPQRKASYHGELLRIKSSPDLILPYIPGAPGSEAIIACTGIDSGSIRGTNYDRVDGSNSRPQLVMLDDPQDDISARQPKEVESRSRRIRKAVQGLAGPGIKLAILMPCTVIEKNDLAYEFTDRDQRPEYAGVRVPAMKSMPEDLLTEHPKWHTYDELRREDLASGDKERSRATAYFLEHQEEMSRGAVLTWPDRVEPGSVNALQSLMDKFLGDRQSFLAEQQQAPESEDDLSIYLDARGIASRFNGLRRGTVTPAAKFSTAAIDVQELLLYWMQVTWSEQLTGWIVNWGHFPRQTAVDFHHMRPTRTIKQWVATEFPHQQFTWEEMHKMAIRACFDSLPKLPVEPGPVLIDSRWHKVKQPIAEVCAEPEYAGILIGAGGVSVGGNEVAISARKMPDGSHRVSTDVEWYWKRAPGGIRTAYFDANYYRSQFQKGLAADPGSLGSITYNATLPDNVLAAHFSAKAVKNSSETKRAIEIWQNKPGQDQDHFHDCAVMCRVAAEIAGYRVSGMRHAGRKQRRKPITQEDVRNFRKRGP